MAKKNYDWIGGAKLEPHTKKKHSVLRDYFKQYLKTRCQLPQQEKFRLVVVDGFSGAGLYEGGELGSPLIFVDELIAASKSINFHRVSHGIRPIQIECLLILNDSNPETIKLLKQNISPYLVKAKDASSNLFIVAEYLSGTFDQIYPQIKRRLISANCSNVLFNLDQCGYSNVTTRHIRDIVSSWKKAEILLTFMIEALLTYLSPNDGSRGAPLEAEMLEKTQAILNDDSLLGKREWLGEVEQIVYAFLKDCAPYVSPFSINNPDGWRYWLMHFANVPKARQVFNDILHEKSGSQAHFGRAGLNMLSYDPSTEGQLYLFDEDSRQAAKKSLYDDIPRFIAESGDTLAIADFYAAAYSETPAHSDDIHKMMIENPDIDVVTESGGKRRQPNAIKASDTLKLKSQTSMFFMFSEPNG